VLLALGEIPDRYLQMVVLFVGASKLLAWSYLMSLMIRYHAFGNRKVFTEVPSLFPSMHHAHDGDEEQDASDSSAGTFSPPEGGDAPTDTPQADRREVTGK